MALTHRMLVFLIDASLLFCDLIGLQYFALGTKSDIGFSPDPRACTLGLASPD